VVDGIRSDELVNNAQISFVEEFVSETGSDGLGVFS